MRFVLMPGVLYAGFAFGGNLLSNGMRFSVVVMVGRVVVGWILLLFGDVVMWLVHCC
jgi:hypothetical protein